LLFVVCVGGTVRDVKQTMVSVIREMLIDDCTDWYCSLHMYIGQTTILTTFKGRAKKHSSKVTSHVSFLNSMYLLHIRMVQ
jgi:hypothetical protein